MAKDEKIFACNGEEGGEYNFGFKSHDCFCAQRWIKGNSLTEKPKNLRIEGTAKG